MFWMRINSFSPRKPSAVITDPATLGTCGEGPAVVGAVVSPADDVFVLVLLVVDIDGEITCCLFFDDT
jgi:hypothetical protein